MDKKTRSRIEILVSIVMGVLLGVAYGIFMLGMYNYLDKIH